MNFTFSVDVSGMERKFSALIESAADMTKPLLRTGGYLRARTKRSVFDVEGPGWAPLAESTRKRKMNEYEVGLLQDIGRGRTGKDRSQVQRIVREADAAEKAHAREEKLRARLNAAREKGRKTETIQRGLAGALGRQAEAIGYIVSLRHRAVAAGIGQGRVLVAYARKELARAKEHGRTMRQYRRMLAARRALAKTLEKTEGPLRFGSAFREARAALASVTLSDAERRKKLRTGARRYRAEESSTRMLGGLRNSLSLRLSGPLTVEVWSKSYIAGIHNNGGVAGNGANIPARPFMFVADSDLNFLVDRCREQMIGAFVSA